MAKRRGTDVGDVLLDIIRASVIAIVGFIIIKALLSAL